MARATKTDIFKRMTPATNRATMTDLASREIIEAEAAARRKKTERLRKLRMAAETPANVSDSNKTK